MRNIETRLAALESAAKVLETRKRSHSPFLLYRPWSMARDEHFVYYYPEGMFQKPIESGVVTYQEAAEFMKQYPPETELEITMGECSEWLIALHHFSDHSQNYTPEQLERFKKRDLEDFPECAYLYEPEGEAMVQLMLKLPQVMFFKLKDLLETIKEE